MKYVETHATADVCIMLLGCKKDLEEYREVETEDARKVKRTEYRSCDIYRLSTSMRIILV